jgi:hypothetical protein
MGNATVTDSGAVTVSPSLTPIVPIGTTMNQVQTVAVTQLKQVNAGISIGNNNTLYGGANSVQANSSGSVSTGVVATSASLGIASNSAAQNIVNVSANIGGGTITHP